MVDLFACNKDNFLVIMHLGVVKVGLLRLAKPEVISQRIILAKTKNSMLDNLSSNFDNP